MIGYQAGAAEAFDELYRLVSQKLLKFLIVKTLDRQWAEELFQETFLQIHRSRSTYLPGKPVTPWLFSIAHHVFLNDRRSRTRRSNREESLEDHLIDFPILSNIEPIVEIDGIKNALASLPSEQRESILLHHYWGFSFKEIGATLGIRTSTAKLRAHRGLISLRERLNLCAVTENRANAKNPVSGFNP